MWRVRCGVHTPRRLQQTTVSCKRSNCNKLKSKKKSWKSTRLRLCEETAQRVSPFCHAALYMSSVADFLVNYHELHQESFHCHQDVLDEEDDGCHCWYCQKGIGASCSSPDSWWRRCSLVNAALKSERSLIVRFFHIYWERSTNSFCVESTHLPSFDRWNLSARPCPSGYRLLQFDQCWFEIHEIRDLLGSDRESLQILSFFASPSLIMGDVVVLLFKSLPITMAMRSPFLNDVVRGLREDPLSNRRIPRLDWFSLKRCPQLQ